MSFSDELIKAGAWAEHGSYDPDVDVVPSLRECEQTAEVVLDAMLAHRSTVECPTCGGTGWLGEATRSESQPCPDCTDGRVPRPERLAVVVPSATWAPSTGVFTLAVGYDADLGMPTYAPILAPDLLDRAEEADRYRSALEDAVRFHSGQPACDFAAELLADLPEGTETCPRCGGTGDVGPRDERGEGVWVDCPVCCIEDPRCAECGRAESRHGSGIRAGILHAFQKPIVPSPADTPNEPPRAQMAPDLPEGTP
jgi:hypothetical protein